MKFILATAILILGATLVVANQSDLMLSLFRARPDLTRVEVRESVIKRLRAGDLLYLKKILDAGVSPNASIGEHSETLLVICAQSGRLELVELLLRRGADPHKPDGTGLTPIRAAASNGHTQIVRAILLADETNKER